MHANIAALSSGIPVVALSYSHKTPGIMELLGQGDLVCNASTLTEAEIVEKTKLAWRDRNARAGHLAEGLPPIRERSRRNIDIIKALLVEGEQTA